MPYYVHIHRCVSPKLHVYARANPTLMTRTRATPKLNVGLLLEEAPTFTEKYCDTHII
jgi:hypothetical protein